MQQSASLLPLGSWEEEDVRGSMPLLLELGTQWGCDYVQPSLYYKPCGENIVGLR